MPSCYCCPINQTRVSMSPNFGPQRRLSEGVAEYKNSVSALVVLCLLLTMLFVCDVQISLILNLTEPLSAPLCKLQELGTPVRILEL